MNNQILVDTNIFIYAVDEDSQFHHASLALLSNAELNLYTTSKNISEFLVVLTRNNALELSTTECLEMLNAVLSDITILYPNRASLKVFQELIRRYNPRGLWIHDIEIASIGLAHGITTIATKNIEDFNRIKEMEVKFI